MFRPLLLCFVALLCSSSADFRSEFVRGTVYFALGNVFDSMARWTWVGSELLPNPLRSECSLISQSCQIGARHAWIQFISKKKTFSSHHSWEQNRLRLAAIYDRSGHKSSETEQLIQFLQKHWLAKQSGFHSFLIDWVCPCFDVPLQVHPATNSAYTRDPASQMSENYAERMKKWQQSLPQPSSFPLLLTRPHDIRPYLPSSIEALPNEPADMLIERMEGTIIDVTDRFSNWHWAEWEAFRRQIVRACEKHQIDPSKLTCLQRVHAEEIAGIRILPLTHTCHPETWLRWISECGLSATQAELEGISFTLLVSDCKSSHVYLRPDLLVDLHAERDGNLSQVVEREHTNQQSKDGPKMYANFYNQALETKEKTRTAKPDRFVFRGTLDHPQKKLFVEATLRILNGLFDAISDDRWASICSCLARSTVIDVSVAKIREEFEQIVQEETCSFFQTTSRLEEIHAHLSSLLAVCSPFVLEDFAPIYQACLKHIPSSLKALVSCGIHSSAMASFAGILKAAEKTAGHPPQILYGENTYFECINAIERIAKASPIQKATQEQWEQVDLIVAQFNPALKRPATNQQELTACHYQIEPIAEVLHRALSARENKPLTVALDCTFDFLDSLEVAQLLGEFEEEITAGILNVVCYRSGLKFDLLGMDNHAGAPFALICQGEHWAFFDALFHDPVLQVDRLSLQWFCLAYQQTAHELDLYRKQIFENTRALLNRVPAHIYATDAKYRIIPMEKEISPGFIDIKISGPFHSVRAATVVSGYLLSQCWEQGHPIFTRRSVGFYHPNFSLLSGKEYSTIRLTLGIDPAQVDLFVRCFEQIDRLNYF